MEHLDLNAPVSDDEVDDTTTTTTPPNTTTINGDCTPRNKEVIGISDGELETPRKRHIGVETNADAAEKKRKLQCCCCCYLL